jgi:hypothetical protein
MSTPPLELFAEIAAEMIVELGDGQVSGLPSEGDAGPFYELLTRW